MVQSKNKPRGLHHDRLDRSVRTWILNFVMCWFALGGLCNVVVGVASFSSKVRVHLHGEPVETPTQRFQLIAESAVVSVIGFTYMLWRKKWQFRLSTLFILTVLWCVVFAAVSVVSPDNFASSISIALIGLVMLCYCIYWANSQGGSVSTTDFRESTTQGTTDCPLRISGKESR